VSNHSGPAYRNRRRKKREACGTLRAVYFWWNLESSCSICTRKWIQKLLDVGLSGSGGFGWRRAEGGESFGENVLNPAPWGVENEMM
jgi:hypothetical protein